MPFVLALVFVVLGLLFRLVPHPANFSPIFAVGLFAGTYFADRRLALGIPLVAMFVSDFFIGFYDPALMAFVYGGVAISAILGFYLRKHKKAGNVLLASIASAVIFFLLSNLGVWVNPASGYARSLSGLWQCYVFALPFLRPTLLSNLLYTAVLFGGYELTLLTLRRKPALNT